MLEHKGEGKILAGGTALVTYLKERWITSKAVLSVSGIHELNYITYEEEKGLRIGACTNLRCFPGPYEKLVCRRSDIWQL